MWLLKKPVSRKEKVGKVSIKEATSFIQQIFQDEEKIISEKVDKNRKTIEDAIAGLPEAVLEAKSLLQGLINEFQVEIEGLSQEEAVENIFAYLWGLGPIEKTYRDPEINEIRVNNPEQVFVLKNLSNEKVDISFRDEQEVKKIIDRIIMHDRGVSLNKSSPRIEVMRKDGTRLTATYPPVSENLTFVLRKQLSQVLTMEQFIKTNTLDEKIWELLEALVKGRANILISGGGGSGKTTLVRSLFGLTNPMARTLVIESDRELFLKKHFPNRDVVELEEHPEAGSPLGDLFRTVLRYSPNLIIVGEFRGAGEAREAIRACERGHYGSMATAHFDSPQEAIEGTGRLLLEEGFNASPQIATLMVAGAYNIVVQMFGDSTRGIIKVESITEVNVHHDQVKFNDLIKWIPDVRDYSVGYWDIVGLPSTQLLSRLRRYGMDLPKYFAQKNP